ncbi:phosphatase PAP2 family protein [Glaciibacter superstes]|uniref:phosphatase PAP2 family protein n=1 Tax=Glaciibacter superstes TaxID=501023 RepID=UPI0003B746F8|nr:phosphatase PAP2 family protein [Glaciibacter superstes]
MSSNGSSNGATDAAATTSARRVSRRWPLFSGIAALVLAVGLGALVALRHGVLEIDEEWMHDLLEERSIWLDVPALAMNYLGGGILAIVVVPIIILIVLLVLKRPWAALFYAAGTLATTGVVQLLKSLFGRARPEDILVTSDFGSFPSGHVANAAVMAATLAIIFPRLWVWLAGAAYTVVMMLSRTYLGAHWLTDTIGGLLIGAGVATVIWAPLAAKLSGERQRAIDARAARRAGPARSEKPSGNP